MKSVLRAVFLATLAVGSAACVRWDTRGPEYAPAPEPKPGFGLVYLYRPKKQWGAAQTFITVVGERVVTLYAGTYVALVLPEGRSEIPHIGSVEAKRGTPAYVRIEFGELVNSWNTAEGARWKTGTVTREEAESDLSELRLGPGGRARYPDDAAPATTAPATGPAALGEAPH